MTIKIEDGSFAEACYNTNSLEELKGATIENADKTDMKAWGLTPEEWVEQVNLALKAKLAEQ